MLKNSEISNAIKVTDRERKYEHGKSSGGRVIYPDVFEKETLYTPNTKHRYILYPACLLYVKFKLDIHSPIQYNRCVLSIRTHVSNTYNTKYLIPENMEK